MIADDDGLLLASHPQIIGQGRVVEPEGAAGGVLSPQGRPDSAESRPVGGMVNPPILHRRTGKFHLLADK